MNVFIYHFLTPIYISIVRSESAIEKNTSGPAKLATCIFHRAQNIILNCGDSHRPIRTLQRPGISDTNVSEESDFNRAVYNHPDIRYAGRSKK